MPTEFALDLRLARRKAGYTQRDIAHLLDAHQATASDLERGRALPNLEQIVTLSLIYGRSFESLFSAIMASARKKLTARLQTLPEHVRIYAGTFNREGSLKRLRHRLAAEIPKHGVD